MGDVRSAERLVAEASSARGLCVPQIRSSHKGSESSIKSYPSARILKSREEMEHWHRLFMCEGEEVRLSPIKHRRLEEHRAMGRTARLLTSRGDIYEGNGSFSPSHTGIAPSLSRTALALHGTSHVGFGGGINVNGAISHGLNYNNLTTFGGYQNSFTPLLGPSLSSNSWGGRSGGAGSTYWNTDYTGNIGGPPPYSANTTTNGDVLAEVRPSYYASDFSHQGAKRTYAPDGTPSSDSSALSYREEFSGQFAVQEGGEFSSHFQYPSSFRGYQRQNFHEDKILSLLGTALSCPI